MLLHHYNFLWCEVHQLYVLHFSSSSSFFVLITIFSAFSFFSPFSLFPLLSSSFLLLTKVTSPGVRCSHCFYFWTVARDKNKKKMQNSEVIEASCKTPKPVSVSQQAIRSSFAIPLPLPPLLNSCLHSNLCVLWREERS